MHTFPIHTLDSAPNNSRPLLDALKRNVGTLPNLAAGMAESPPLLEGFLAVREIYQRGSFSGAEIQVLSLTAAFENECSWCVAFHSLMAKTEGVPDGDIVALRRGLAPADKRLGALSDFARAMLRRRGAVSDGELKRLLDAGYTRAQALEVALGLSFSLMANYAGHLVAPPLDAPLEPHAWQAPHAHFEDAQT
jgi:AhpD family alkylhydroperoxidase